MSDVAEIAIVGSGPSGFYAAEALLRSDRACRIDMFERLPMPYGLVRYGVAPDHQKLKSVTAIFERIASSESLRLLAGVEIGRDLKLAELLENYHAVVIASGTSQARALGVAGESLGGVCSSSAFVGWYNGHPDCVGSAPLSLQTEGAVVLGHGNVAIDATRLLAKPVEQLLGSDVPNDVLQVFRGSTVKTVHLIGRGAPGKAKFTAKELRELGELEGVRVVFPQGTQRVFASLESSPGNADLLPVWKALAEQPARDATREIHIWFGLGAIAFQGNEHLEAVRFQATDRDFAESEDNVELRAGHAITCIGYRGDALGELACDSKLGVIPNARGRVLNAPGDPVSGLYVTGWIKRGPTGVIGTNRADSLETTASMLEDWPSVSDADKPGRAATDALLNARAVRVFSFADWQAIDRYERAHAREGAPREKVLSREQSLAVLSHAVR